MKAFPLIKYLAIFALFTGCSPVTKKTPQSIEENNQNQKSYHDCKNMINAKNYKLALDSVIYWINCGHVLSTNELLNVIPKSNEEYLLLYELTYPEQDSSKQIAFNYIDKQMRELALQGNIDVFVAYLNLSPFIDGEYAEGYYDDAEFIIKNNSNLFCDVFETLSKEAIVNFTDIRFKICSKNIK